MESLLIYYNDLDLVTIALYNVWEKTHWDHPVHKL